MLVVRDSRGKVGAFLNTCRHRGMRVCRADAGNAAAFTCTYHGWTYGNDGKLVGVPGYKEYYYEEMDMEQWGLVPVAQVDSYKGLIFGNFDSQAVPLLEYLGDMAYYLDLFVDRREGGIELIGGVHKWMMKCNWKFAADNFVGDGYHVPVSHISAARVGFGTAPPNTRQGQQRGLAVNAGGGHGLGASLDPISGTGTLPPIIKEYVEGTMPEAENRLGPRAGRIASTHGTVFPNFSILPELHTIRVWQPRGPDRTEVWAWGMVDAAAPPEVKEEIRLRYLRSFGASGTFEQDDGENWHECTKTSSGFMGRQHWLNYHMRQGQERHHEEFPGVVSESPSEVAQRGFYEKWADLMATAIKT